MKRPSNLLQLLVVVLAMVITSCSKQDRGAAKGQSQALVRSPSPTFSLAELRRLPPFQATVLEVMLIPHHDTGTAVFVALQREYGQPFGILESYATPNETGFVSVISTGRNYAFPKVYLDYE